MRLDGYWVSAEWGTLQVSAGEFYDTKLSDHSGGKEV